MYSPADYDFMLPDELIAQHPLPERDRSRLLHLRRADGRWQHGVFGDLVHCLNPGDVLVLNDTRVIPGRLLGRKDSGGKVEALILDFADGMEKGVFHCLIKASKRPLPGSRLFFEPDLEARVLAIDGQAAELAFSGAADLESALEARGHIPLPPYIRRQDTDDDRRAYQTVFAVRKGAIAAPTAGLHFTRALLTALERKGVRPVYLTLHVGYGTFEPLRVNDIRDHRMHAEAFSVPAETAAAVNAAKASGHRVVAVGTTCVRTIEFRTAAEGRLAPGSGWCDLFIYPGYPFKTVDAMITNFHLPRSTLMMLVSAFAGRELILAAYADAVQRKYRFFSYGDAMLIE